VSSIQTTTAQGSTTSSSSQGRWTNYYSLQVASLLEVQTRARHPGRQDILRQSQEGNREYKNKVARTACAACLHAYSRLLGCWRLGSQSQTKGAQSSSRPVRYC